MIFYAIHFLWTLYILQFCPPSDLRVTQSKSARDKRACLLLLLLLLCYTTRPKKSGVVLKLGVVVLWSMILHGTVSYGVIWSGFVRFFIVCFSIVWDNVLCCCGMGGEVLYMVWYCVVWCGIVWDCVWCGIVWYMVWVLQAGLPPLKPSISVQKEGIFFPLLDLAGINL